LAATGSPVPIDLIAIHHDRDECFINAATAGFGAEVTAGLTAGDKRQWGAFAYWLAATSHLGNMHPYELDLVVDNESLRGSAYGLTIANGCYIGGGFPIASTALLDDGLLDIVIIPVASNMELLSGAVNYLMGYESSERAIIARRARQIVIRSAPPLWFSLDGEPIRLLEATVEVIPRKLPVVAGERPALLAAGQTGVSIQDR
jgi:diacylglycerol kinase (ATP)